MDVADVAFMCHTQTGGAGSWRCRVVAVPAAS